MSIALIVGGFFVPPVGVIDGSVLTAVRLLLTFNVIAKIPEAIKAGKTVKISKGDVTPDVGAELNELTDILTNLRYEQSLSKRQGLL